MSVKAFLATAGHGLASATCSKQDAWSVEVLLTEQDVRCLAADPLHPEIIYAGTQGKGVLRSNDSGKTWRSAGLTGQIVKALAISPTQPGLSPGRGLTGTMAGQSLPIPCIQKYGMPRLLLARDQPTASTMHKRLLCVRLEELRGR